MVLHGATSSVVSSSAACSFGCRIRVCCLVGLMGSHSGVLCACYH
ncbi:UNVERIFIED_ORG: hypothetical protein QOE_0074 [Clostridioides difficile F501]